MTDAERRIWFEAFCADLAHKSDAEIAYACGRYRQNPANRFFPTPGQLLALTVSPFADKPARSNGRMVDGSFQPWGGACQCDRCMKKTPSEWFFRASRAEHTRGNETLAELDYWIERQTGYDPKIGDPSLDNTVERWRSPEELQALLESARAKYLRAFAPGNAAALERPPTPYVEATGSQKVARGEALSRRMHGKAA